MVPWASGPVNKVAETHGVHCGHCGPACEDRWGEGSQRWSGLTSFFAVFCCTSASLAISQCLLPSACMPPSDGADAPVPSPLAEVLVEGVPLPSFFEAFHRLEPPSVLRARERGAGGGWLSDMPEWQT